MLSDLTGVLASARRHPVVLAGDLNLTTQFPSSTPTQADRQAVAAADAVFARLHAWGLVDCLCRTYKNRPRLERCTCLSTSPCSHVQTFRSNNRADSTPTQLDYAFLSNHFRPSDVRWCRRTRHGP